MASEDALYSSTGPHFLLEAPLDPQHPPVGLNRNSCEPFFLTVFLSITRRIKFQLDNILDDFITDIKRQSYPGYASCLEETMVGALD